MREKQIKEWVGKTDDSMPSANVRLRIFEKHGGICHLSGKKITPADKWELDHIKPLWIGGENRENNLAPALKEAHKEKTTDDARNRAKAKRIKAKHFGINKSNKAIIPGSRASKWKRKLNGEVVKR